MPEPFFIHEDEIVIWTQNQNLYCQFRVVEGDTKECARLLTSVFELLNQQTLKWEYNIPTECIPLFFGSESSAILIEEI